jgi:uncharacterized protein
LAFGKSGKLKGMPPANAIRSIEELTALFPKPGGGAVAKEINALDENCRSYLEHCPFIAMGTTNPDGTGDVSPKGGIPGFVKMLSANMVAWGELPGNNRLDGYRNLVRDPRIGVLAIIPGLDETLRINGLGYVTTDINTIDAVALEGRRPKVAVVVDVAEAFIHCAKAFRRSSLWKPNGWPSVDTMPTIECMLVDHVGVDRAKDPGGAATRAGLEENYATTLWNES